MAEQLSWGQRSAALTTACCCGRGGSTVVARAQAGFVAALGGAWSWENWGKGRREREEIKNDKIN